MRIYLTGETKDTESGQMFCSALSFYNKIYKFETPNNGEETRFDVLHKAMLQTGRWIKQNPGISEKLLEYGLSFDTDLLADSYRETVDKVCRNNKIYSLLKETADLCGLMRSQVEIVNLDIKKVKDNLIKRTYHPLQDASYHFKPNDLIICSKDTPDSFTLFARVIEADRKTNILSLNRFTDYGNICWKPTSQNLLEMELQHYYRPMTNDEVLMFYEGLSNLKANPIKLRAIEDKNAFNETYSIVTNRAEKIEQERKTKELDL